MTRYVISCCIILCDQRARTAATAATPRATAELAYTQIYCIILVVIITTILLLLLLILITMQLIMYTGNNANVE